MPVVGNLAENRHGWHIRAHRAHGVGPKTLEPTFHPAKEERVTSFSPLFLDVQVHPHLSGLGPRLTQRLVSQFLPTPGSVRKGISPSTVYCKIPVLRLWFCFLFWTVSGEVPEVPVISPASGSVFEKRLIEKHLVDNDTDPINGEPLTADQLIAVSTST